MVVYGMDPYAFFLNNQKKYGDVYSYVMGGRTMTCALGIKGNDLVFNGKLSQVSAEEAYTALTTPVFGKGVVYDVPNHVFMEQKKFIKFSLTTEILHTYVPLIVEEFEKYVSQSGKFGVVGQKSGVTNLMTAIPELTIFTAARSLQGQEVREGFDASFARLYHDLDRGFTPLNMLFPNLPLPSYRKRDRAQQKMAETYFAIIRKRREQGSPPRDMIDSLMNQTYKDGRSLSDAEIAHIMIALLMAGQHTSSATMSWTLLHLGEDPDIV
ncbi:Lanosterol 14-alpha demethylase erg11 [Neolecta irregularis DAH-3]|uniref:Lanosterol 14-alpha demethylase erg11 n=1 Tax=Neolecta irregularis (strain DAH-3) TaxID=1198029 RepID=A0A1U7LSI1_NEOID|nr:Lanosterol 14-alpha demethylase erg11 [Neolecta irregularis DAH-3]|eukprot:OLL25630.1 Lanosterol 14-alpha demethylase erg11 [Neolecta irregularis DAH-3]